MKERPIIFSGAMVEAILDGRKTQTRRVLRPQPVSNSQGGALVPLRPSCPYGYIGDKLWVRETWTPDGVDKDAAKLLKRAPVHYRADGEAPEFLNVKWRSPRFMPRWASRITLEITDVRVQRLQAISEEDALAEGVVCNDGSPFIQGIPTTLIQQPREEFMHLWDSINAKRGYGWDSNPWVWAIMFRQLEGREWKEFPQ